MGDTRLETSLKTAEKAGAEKSVCTSVGSLPSPDAELQYLIDRWAKLSAEQRATILRVVGRA